MRKYDIQCFKVPKMDRRKSRDVRGVVWFDFEAKS